MQVLTALLDSFNTFTTSDRVNLTDEQQSDAYIDLASDGQMFTLCLGDHPTKLLKRNKNMDSVVCVPI